MRIGDLSREHRHLWVVYLSETMAISGTLDYFRVFWVGGTCQQVLTIGGWVSPPLPLDSEIEVHVPDTGLPASKADIDG